MAEESGELKLTGEPDAVSTAAGAKQDALIEKYPNDYLAETDDTETLEKFEDDSDTSEETEQLKSQIEETRSQMSSTIDAIQDKLSFQNISDQVREQVSEHIGSALETAKETVYDATIGKLGGFMNMANKGLKEASKSKAAQTAWQNPAALSLIGIGVGALLVAAFRKKSSTSYKYKGGRNYSARNNSDNHSLLQSAQTKIANTAGDAYDSVSNATGAAYKGVSNAAGSAYNTVANAAGNVYDTATETAGNAVSSAKDFSGRAYDKAGDYGSQAREQYEYHIEENPLAVGALALALGAAVGLAIPSTDYENKILGEARNDLLSKAKDSAGDLVSQFKQVAADSQKAFTDDLKSK